MASTVAKQSTAVNIIVLKPFYLKLFVLLLLLLLASIVIVICCHSNQFVVFGIASIDET